jgi:uncharacterized RDD family membrane protein YckC
MTYHLARNNQQAGTCSDHEIRRRLASGDLSPQDLCWTEGMNQWQPLGEVFAEPEEVAAATPQAPPPAAPLATLSQRLSAALIDGVPLAAIFFLTQSGLPDEDGQGGSDLQVAIGLILMLALAGCNLYLLATRGQTIGKKLQRIRIVALEGDHHPGLFRVFWLRSFINGLIGSIPLFGPIPVYSLIDVLCIFGRERRCIHDYLAQTRVVQGDPP